MRILLLAAQPYFTERGTPIAVDLLIDALVNLGHHVDLITLHLGEDRPRENVSIQRVHPLLPIRQVKPGFSMSKLWCDLFMGFQLISRLIRNRKTYDVVHAVEEMAIVASWVCPLFRIKYLYDMDSCLSDQLCSSNKAFKLLDRPIRALERIALRRAHAVVSVCDALTEFAEAEGAKKVFTLKDISLLDREFPKSENIVTDDYVAQGNKNVMYVGNLEYYQGIELLIGAFPHVLARVPSAQLVVIGGDAQDIEHCVEMTKRLGIRDSALFLGPRPVSRLNEHLVKADVLVSPRLTGENTPMKIYSYMDSLSPIVATRIASHTQVLSEQRAMLTEVEEHALAEGIIQVLEDEELVGRLTRESKEFARKHHSFESFCETVAQIYNHVSTVNPATNNAS